MLAGIGHRQFARAQLIGHFTHAVAHRLPVVDDGAHILQHLSNLRLDAGQRRLRLAVDFQIHQRFVIALTHRHQFAGFVAIQTRHRVTQQMHANAKLGQHHAHRVHQERHIVVGNLQHGVRRHRRVGLQHRIEQLNIGLAAFTCACKLQHSHNALGPAGSTVTANFFGIHALTERHRKGAGLFLRGFIHTLDQGIKDRFQRFARVGFS